MDRWRALVNAVMNIRAPKIVGNLLTENRFVFQEGPCSMIEGRKEGREGGREEGRKGGRE
jgi:hypothetical protein